MVVFPGATPSSFSLHEEDDTVTTINASIVNNRPTVTISRTLAPTLLRIRTETKPTGVLIESGLVEEHPDRMAFDAASSGAYYEASTRSMWVKVHAQSAQSSIELLLP